MRRNKNYVNLSVQLRPKGQNPNNKNMETETLEEANWKVLGTKNDTFYNGAKWQAERMYSEEDLKLAFKHGILFKEESVSTCEEAIKTEFSMLVEQFKKN